jgi:hypothetical protein
MWALVRFLVAAAVVVLFLSLAGVAGFALYFRFASRAAKSERPWEKLDDAETASIRQAKREPIESTEPSIVNGASNSEISLQQKPPHTAWEDSSYCWVVVCKNHWFHRRPNIFHVHRIPLGETDAVTPRPKIGRPFLVRCDDCRTQYAYKPSEVLRYEQEVPESFAPHPLFREQS